MASVDARSRERTPPALAATYDGGDPRLLERIAALADVIEVSPDGMATSDGNRTHLRPSALDECAAVRGQSI